MESSSRAPRSKTIYMQGIPEGEPWLTLEEMAPHLGVTKNRTCQLLNVALQKVAASVLQEMNGRKPTAEETLALSKDTEFHIKVSDILWEDHHNSRKKS